MIKLRGYQKNQMNFIQSRLDISNIVAVESPTGSGKTFVMLEYAKEWLAKPENALSNVIITTGFNNLVFLLEQRAKEMGLNPIVLIGTKSVNCPVLMKEDSQEYKVFTKTDQYRCGDVHKHLDINTKNWSNKVCPYCQAAYSEHYRQITEGVGNIIITNHSSLLVHQNRLTNSSLLIIDEAHTFSMFYDNYLKIELSREDLSNIDKSICSIQEPMQTIIKRNMQNFRNLPPAQLKKICENMDDIPLKFKTEQFFGTKPSNSVYIDRSKFGYSIDRFYRSFELDINPKIILFSATLDNFTLDMFNVRYSNVYREYTSFCDYSQSEFIAIPNEDFKQSLLHFLKYVSDKGLMSGLVLSTTISDMKIALKCEGFEGYKMFDDLQQFQEYNGKKILVGSRGLFQGIDIPDLQFVCLNKIPFPNWDDKMQAQQNYLTNNGQNGFDPWKQFTIPKTENDIIQSTGRLWRSSESKGVISIFDHRIEKFKYMIRHTMDKYRHGIETNIMDSEGNVKLFNIKERI